MEAHAEAERLISSVLIGLMLFWKAIGLELEELIELSWTSWLPHRQKPLPTENSSLEHYISE